MRARRGTWALVVAAALTVVLAASPALAVDPVHPPPPPSPIFWSPDWPRVRPVEVIGASMLTGLSIYLLVESPESPWWSGPNRMDEAVRRAVRPESRRTRAIAARVSDFFLAGLLTHDIIVDPAVAAGPRHSIDVGEQIVGINGETLILSLTVHTILADVFGRERPFGRLCVGDKADAYECRASGRYRSFYSGHTTMAFTAASLVCTTHMNLPLYGQPWDAVACATGIAMAATVGSMRILGDRHYATDVLLGMTTGLTAGFLAPWILHYRGGLLDASQGAGLVLPRGTASFPVGPSWSGTF